MLTIGYVTRVTSRSSHILRDIADLPVPGGPENIIPLEESKISVVNSIISLPNFSIDFSTAIKCYKISSFAFFNYSTEKL